MGVFDPMVTGETVEGRDAEIKGIDVSKINIFDKIHTIHTIHTIHNLYTIEYSFQGKKKDIYVLYNDSLNT